MMISEKKEATYENVIFLDQVRRFKGRPRMTQAASLKKKSTSPNLHVAPKARRRPVAGGRQKAPNGVIDEVLIAFQKRNRLATAVGFILGGFVPVGTFTVAHYELSQIQSWNLGALALLVMVLGGLTYSALTVYQWGHQAFENTFKALGFVVLVEGIMTLSSISWLSYAALGVLVAINGIATGTKLALKRTL